MAPGAERVSVGERAAATRCMGPTLRACRPGSRRLWPYSCWPVTVIAGVRTADGVFLAADRAAVDPGRQIAPNVFANAGERAKLAVSPAGVGVTLAGCAGTGGEEEAGDLVAAVRAVIAARPRLVRL